MKNILRVLALCLMLIVTAASGAFADTACYWQLEAIEVSSAVDSAYGPATEAAVKKYQAEHGLPAHGVTDKATRQMMLGIEG
jgi:murein L,D-transpeptidase YcbB/YkuD